MSIINQGNGRHGKRLLRLKEAASYLGISPWKLREMAHQGEVPYVRFAENGMMLFDVRDLDVHIDRNKHHAYV